MTREALEAALQRAADLWSDRAAWRTLQSNAMRADVSWAEPAGEFAALYARPASVQKLGIAGLQGISAPSVRRASCKPSRQGLGPTRGDWTGRTMNILELPDRERALRDDVRLVGRVLGDTVRQQQGEAVFATVERIRQISIAFRREGDAAARRELEAMLDSLSHDRTIEVVRAFSYFSHLANIAEDQHRSAACARSRTTAPAPRGTIHNTLASLKAARRAARNLAGVVRHDPGEPGAHRASDRSAAQERARPRDGGRATARRPRSDAADARGGRRHRQRACRAPS